MKINYLKSKLRLMFDLSKNDYKVRYTGSFLGIVWGVINPFMTLLVYWFVFDIGFRSGARPDGTPFIVWLSCGMIIWFFISEALMTSTSSFMEYSYLVKKVSFDIFILPIIKIISAFFNHLFFLCVLIIILLAYGIHPNVVNIQIFYYLICTFYLLIGVVLITSSLMVFIRDIGQLMGLIIQIGFWLIPIVWSPEIISKKYIILFKLNPIYYIVEGYRDTFIDHVWFWHRYNQTTYFWILSTILLIAGLVVFKKLRPHFADVL